MIFTDEEFEDILNCISITQREYSGKKDSPNFMRAVERLRKKVWKMKRQNAKRVAPTTRRTLKNAQMNSA